MPALQNQEYVSAELLGFWTVACKVYEPPDTTSTFDGTLTTGALLTPLTTTLSLTEPPLPLQIIEYVFDPSGTATDDSPDAGWVPVQDPNAAQAEALVEVHDSATDCPAVTLSGPSTPLARKSAVGVTLTGVTHAPLVHVKPDAQVPQFSVPPQPSPQFPQVWLNAMQVVAAQPETTQKSF